MAGSKLNSSDYAPLAILLVKDGSRGDKLLYKYPYCHCTFKLDDSSEINEDASSNPYTFSDSDSGFAIDSKATSSNISSDGFLTGFTDTTLSKMLAVKLDFCDRRFELQVNDVRFIGYPKLMDSTKKTSLQMFHLAFALRTRLQPEIVDGYFSLCQRLATSLHFMDHITRYTSEQVNIMVSQHEKAANPTQEVDTEKEDPFDVISHDCTLAQELATIYKSLCSDGTVSINIQHWFNVSFVIPHKVYSSLPESPYFNFKRMHQSKRLLKRYMSIMLLKNRSDFETSSFPLVNSSMKKIIQMITPTSTLNKIAFDAGVTYEHLKDTVSHFVTWGMMRVIYPVCTSNKYVVSSKAVEIIRKFNFEKEFRKSFPDSNSSLHDYMIKMRWPTAVNDLTIGDKGSDALHIILWMLERALISQVHKYVYLNVPVQTEAMAVSEMKAKRVLRFTNSLPIGSGIDQQSMGSFPKPLIEDLSDLNWNSGDCPDCLLVTKPNKCTNCLRKLRKWILEKEKPLTLKSFSYEEWCERRNSFSYERIGEARCDLEVQNILMEGIILDYLFGKKTEENAEQANALKKYPDFDYDAYLKKKNEDRVGVEKVEELIKKQREGMTKRQKKKVDRDEGLDGCRSSNKKKETFEEKLMRGFSSFLKASESFAATDEGREKQTTVGKDLYQRYICDMKGTLRAHRLMKDEAPVKSKSGTDTKSQIIDEITTLLSDSTLTASEERAVLLLFKYFKSTILLQDIRHFIRLSDYFRGEHHVEEMMYGSNLEREEVMSVVEKFKYILCVVERPASNYPVNVLW